MIGDVGTGGLRKLRHGDPARGKGKRGELRVIYYWWGDGLFELRPRGRSGIGRAFYCFLVGKRVVVLYAFIKKSQETPDRELKLARKRLKEVSNA